MNTCSAADALVASSKSSNHTSSEIAPQLVVKLIGVVEEEISSPQTAFIMNV